MRSRTRTTHGPRTPIADPFLGHTKRPDIRPRTLPSRSWHLTFRDRRPAEALPCFLILLVLYCPTVSAAEPVPVHHLEGITHGFLVLRDLDGKAIAHGELDQLVSGKDGVVTADMNFHFNDGSSFREITKFTQHGEFRLVSDKVTQKGPSFKQQSESEIDAKAGNITVRTVDGGKEKVTTKHMDLLPDVANGMLPVLMKNLSKPGTPATVSMVAVGASPRLVHLNIIPLEETTLKYGAAVHKTQHFVVKIRIGGIAGVIAPLVGKQPPDIQFWILETGAPVFLQSEGQLSADTPVWRIQIGSPDAESLKAAQ